MRASRHLAVSAVAAFLAMAAVPPAPPASADPAGGAVAPAFRLEAGSLARRQIVALNRDMEVAGTARRHAVVINGSLRLTGKVEGDVIVIGGDAVLGEAAVVGGDVYVLSGAIVAHSGSRIGGHSVAYPDAASLWVGLIEGPSLGQSAASPVVLGAKLALLAFWAFLLTLVIGVARRELVATSQSVRQEPFRNFFLGLVGVAAMVLTALFFTAFAGAGLGVPLLVLVMVVALVLRFWGMVAVFHALGEALFQALRKRPPLPVATATCGLLVLGVLKLFPLVGIWTWSLATFIGVGATLGTKFGRRQAWFEAA